MRFFSRRKDQARPKAHSEPYCVQLSGRNYEELEKNDASLKFWLPESVEKKIDEMCAFQDTSASDLIRQILFIHLYGRYDLFGLIERQIETFDLHHISAVVMEIKDDYAVLEPVEKNIADIKVWIPSKMKADIILLAQQSEKKPSAYVREVIISHLFGHVPPNGISIDMLPPDGHIEDVF